jgi:hypothetical protein
MPYYPEHTFIIGLATIRRERRLPPGAIGGEVLVKEGLRVEAADMVLRGMVPGDYLLLKALAPLGLRHADELNEDVLQVQAGSRVEKGGIIAVRGEGRGARTLKSPTDAVIARIEEGEIILQANPRPVEVQAMCPGEITSVRGTSEVLLETVGALIQCAWGNGKQVYSVYKAEPPEGIESLQGESLLQQDRATALVMTHPILSSMIFNVALEQEITAIIAPSMRADLREAALRQTIPLILTEGFGEQKMSEIVYNLLRDNLGRPALISAIEPERWSSSRPEIIIPLPSGGTLPPAPEMDQPLAEGALVRMTRAPLAGMTGRVWRIADAPRTVENGLRLPGAEVQLSSERTVFVPLANLELVGRSADAPGTGGG